MTPTGSSLSSGPETDGAAWGSRRFDIGTDVECAVTGPGSDLQTRSEGIGNVSFDLDFSGWELYAIGNFEYSEALILSARAGVLVLKRAVADGGDIKEIPTERMRGLKVFEKRG